MKPVEMKRMLSKILCNCLHELLCYATHHACIIIDIISKTLPSYVGKNNLPHWAINLNSTFLLELFSIILRYLRSFCYILTPEVDPHHDVKRLDSRERTRITTKISYTDYTTVP